MLGPLLLAVDIREQARPAFPRLGDPQPPKGSVGKASRLTESQKRKA